MILHLNFEITKACLQFLFLLLLTVFVLVHTDKAKTKIIGVRVDDKFGCAEDEENMSMQSHCVEK